MVYHDQHRDREAVQEFQAAIRLRPDGPDAHYSLAQVYLQTGEGKRGQEELQLYDKLRKEEAARVPRDNTHPNAPQEVDANVGPTP